ncbi:MAG: SDR family NAD(P)-dependent oxidoreductase [Cyanomargarita calcarea GSE-NOS-MK-12-04C]|jgi:NAD(P)-dependent dehydrogenase (short-subunit alcohol dehydrogenase family)|uniref:SDR family NAD(P)-dependent oxidoreductase n=1 Tax=Cyanomargarita calcarea GSE-NOS-MK-12-04C TaxID=2839659 RepID=A0A951QJ37_9CYAN|nr:SDR family NAD(P)-dependent oxidoreductase [Cyanomargarita calcarea GSE-NOS-MK-12-04C]
MVISSDKKTRVWFITGCSSGFGRALAETVLERGETVVLTARNPQQIKDLAASFPDRTLAVQLDVTKPEEVREAVKQAIANFGCIDVLVNNAGCEVAGVIEEVPDKEVRREFETNFFGVLEVLRAVLPHMRQQRSGHILNFSSIACFDAGAGGGIYSSSKLALEGISGSLAGEVAPFGIKVTIVEPGGFQTDFFNRSYVLIETKIEDYKPLIDEISQTVQDIQNLTIKLPGNPRKAALAMIKVVDSDNPPIRLALGADTVETVEGALEFMKSELDAWREVSMSTDYDEVTSEKIEVSS